MGQKNNRLERILDILCQDRKEQDNMQILSVDEEMMGDEEMRRIVTRLLSAASDTHVRHSMNIEEEINTALENRDTEIMLYKNEAMEAKKVIAEKDEQISLKDEQIVSAIRLLHRNGLNKELIASSLNISLENVVKALNG